MLTVFGPLVRLSPPPNDKDYFFNLAEYEGVSDLFDVPLLSKWPQAYYKCAAIVKV